MIQAAHPVSDDMLAMKILEEIGCRDIGVHMGIYEVDLGRDSATPHACQKRDEVWIGK